VTSARLLIWKLSKATRLERKLATPAIHPDTIFSALFSKPGRSERRDALTRLQQICRQQCESGSRDFSITQIGKECEAQGIIKSRALYNAPSADYRALIDAWAVYSRPRNAMAPRSILRPPITAITMYPRFWILSFGLALMNSSGSGIACGYS
jgi:hypothetical protein